MNARERHAASTRGAQRRDAPARYSAPFLGAADHLRSDIAIMLYAAQARNFGFGKRGYGEHPPRGKTRVARARAFLSCVLLLRVARFVSNRFPHIALILIKGSQIVPANCA